MKTLSIRLRTFFTETSRLFKSRFTRSQKWCIFRTYSRLAFSSVFGHQTKTQVERMVCGLRMTTFSHSTLLVIFREVFMRGVYFFKPSMDAPRILDCGGNIGTATLFFKWMYPNSIIDTFEPDPTTYAVLEKNVRINKLSGVTTHNIALGKDDGSVPFFIDKTVSGSPKMSIKPLEESDKSTMITVPMKRLSSFITEPIDYLKIDTEGAETDIIKELYENGALKHVKEIDIEYHHHLGGAPSNLSELLFPLEKAGFDYKLDARFVPSAQEKGSFQHIMIYAFRKR